MAGLTVAHFGVTLFLLSDLGADPFNVLVQGVCRTLEGATAWGLSHGSVHRLLCFGIILILLAVDKRYVKVGTLLCMFCGGPIIDVFTRLLTPVLNGESPILFRYLALAAGCVILAFGMTVVIRSDAGTGPNDLVALIISEKSGAKFSIVRVVTDVCFVAVGWLFGGVFGAGTLICSFLVGPVAGFFMPRSERLVQTVLKKCGMGESVCR